MEECKTKDCSGPVCFEVYWPGQPMAYMCIDCATRTKNIADNVLGFHLVMKPVTYKLEDI
jgi:hypothetical protein